MNTMKFELKKYAFLLFLWIPIIVFAQQPAVNIKADTTQIRIGEQIRLSVEVQTDTLHFVDFPELKDLGNFEVVKGSLPDTLEKRAKLLLRKDYYLTAWDTGKIMVPPIKISVGDSILITDSIPDIKVLGVKIDTINQPAYGYKSIINIDGKDASKFKKNKFGYAWLWLILFLPLLYFLYKKRKKIFYADKFIDPYQEAIKKWEKLKEENLWKQQEHSKHYFRLTHLFKEYLENEPKISAKEKISSELLQDLKKFRFENGEYFSPALLERLEESLKRADLAKYANMSITDAEVDLDMQTIRDVIDQSHKILATIKAEKERKNKEIEAAKRRKKRVLYVSLGVILAILLSIGGLSYYFLNKYGVFDQLSQNISSPEWIYNEYGGNPAIGITTPHILSPYDINKNLSKEEKILLDELPGEWSVYAEENIVKGYAIIEMNIDLDKPLFKDNKIPGDEIVKLLLNGIQAKNIKIEKDQTDDGLRFTGEFDLEIPKLKITRKFDFIAQSFSGDNYVRLVFVAYKKGSKENKVLAEKVMNSIEMIKD
jgi:hypothetical protein